jgi:anti-sigma factor RsiW
MKPFEEQFTAWVDGRLSGEELAEFEKQLAEHPEAAGDKQEALKLGKFLREHPTAPGLTNPDFFNHQLMQRIAAETPRPAEKPHHGSMWFLSRLAWAGAFCLLVAFGLYKALISPTVKIGQDPNYFAQVVEAWPSDPSISATTVYSPEDNVTVVWLDGLDYIPATYALN